MLVSNRSDIINYLISLYGYNSYLEIGVRDNRNFNRISAKNKDGVDPRGKCKYKMQSDKFFRKIPATQMYDIVFIDGLHTKEQVLKDITNSLKHLNQNGTIVMHDCNPIAKEHATPKKKTNRWNGTVWEAFAELRMTRTDLFMCTVKKDTGCGIIRRGSQKMLNKHTLTFDYLDKNRKEILNLMTAKEFIEFFGKENV